MDPPSPSKFPMSPGMPIFPVSPERAAGIKPLYGAPASNSPSLPNLGTSPLRSHHKRNDSDVSVLGLAARFETLKVKDAEANFEQRLDKVTKKYEERVERLNLRMDQLNDELKLAQMINENSVDREQWDKQRASYRQTLKGWEDALKQMTSLKKQAESKTLEVTTENKALRTKVSQYKSKCLDLHKQNIAATGKLPSLQVDFQNAKRDLRRTESDLKFKSSQAESYKNQVYGLQVDLESAEARLGEEIQTLRDRLKLVEGERDALKTSLKEEEVLRIAAEGRIPLPAATTEEQDEFGSPVRSPRKQRTPERDDDDKENVAPKKGVVDLKFFRQELAAEKRLRQRAQEQIDFMKMECQFRCCSCRIADLKGNTYVHDNDYAIEMERIKASVPELTPPSSDHGDDLMDGMAIKEEPVEDVRQLTSPEASGIPATATLEETTDLIDQTDEFSTPADIPASPAAEPIVAFSPGTGTFRALPAPVDPLELAQVATPAKSTQTDLATLAEPTTTSSPWTPDAGGTMIRHETASPPPFKFELEGQLEKPTPKPKLGFNDQSIVVHEDEDSVGDSDGEDLEPQTPLHGPSAPATPGQYLTRTITTTTTIPLHFSPVTPAAKGGANNPMTPATIAHAPSGDQSQVLGEVSLNKLPFDREAALEAIRQRRGRARSMAAGHGTPAKQMMQGVKERRDISAPVARVRR